MAKKVRSRATRPEEPDEVEDEEVEFVDEEAPVQVTPEEDFPRKRLAYLKSVYDKTRPGFAETAFEEERKARFDPKVMAKNN